MEDLSLSEASIEHLITDAYKLRMINPHKSFQLAQKAYHQAVDVQSAILELRAIHTISITALFYKDFPDPEYWLDLLEKRSRELDKPSYKGMCLIQRSRWSYMANKLEQSVEYLHHALEYFTPEIDVLNFADCYNSLGKVYFDSGEYDKAYDFYLKARPFVSKLAVGYQVGIEQNIGAVLLAQGQYAEAWNIFHDVLLQVPPTELVAKTNILQNLGQICQFTNEYEDALEYFKQALEIKQNAGMQQELIRTISCIADIYIDYNKTECAYEYLQKASDLLNGKEMLEHVCLYKTYIKYFEKIKDAENQSIYEAKLSDAQSQIDENDNLTKGASKRI